MLVVEVVVDPANEIAGGVLYGFHYENLDHKIWFTTLVIAS